MSVATFFLVVPAAGCERAHVCIILTRLTSLDQFFEIYRSVSFTRQQPLQDGFPGTSSVRDSLRQAYGPPELEGAHPPGEMCDTCVKWPFASDRIRVFLRPDATVGAIVQEGGGGTAWLGIACGVQAQIGDLSCPATHGDGSFPKNQM